LQLISPLALLEREEPLIRGSLKPTVRLRISPQEHGRPVLPVWLQPSDFSQILLNLSLNANDAMPHGGTLTFEVFTVDSTELPASTDQIPPGTWTLVRVTDSGEGMSSEVMEQAFDPFFTTRPPETYTGLGLTTVRELMNNAGGRIALSSTVGAGTEFRLYYPVSGPSPAATIATRD
jgi:signal transduction histidine kinase